VSFNDLGKVTVLVVMLTVEYVGKRVSIRIKGLIKGGIEMNDQTQESIDKLLELNKACNEPENKDDMDLMDKYWQQVRLVVYNLLSELYEDESAEYFIKEFFKLI